jgi:hypothetical protein
VTIGIHSRRENVLICCDDHVRVRVHCDLQDHVVLGIAVVVGTDGHTDRNGVGKVIALEPTPKEQSAELVQLDLPGNRLRMASSRGRCRDDIVHMTEPVVLEPCLSSPCMDAPLRYAGFYVL